MYQPLDAEQIHGRSALVIDPSLEPPLSAELHERIIDEVEQHLLKHPHLGQVRSRKDMQKAIKQHRSQHHQLELFSDTLTVLGVVDGDGSSQLRPFVGVELFVAPQLFYMVCPACEFGNAMALVVHLVEAETGELLWRGHFTSSVSDDPRAQEEVARELIEEFMQHFEEDLRPKWHRLRFKGLSRIAS